MGYITTSGILYIYMQCILCIHAAPCKRCIRLHEEKCGKARKKNNRRAQRWTIGKKGTTWGTNNTPNERTNEWRNDNNNGMEKQAMHAAPLDAAISYSIALHALGASQARTSTCMHSTCIAQPKRTVAGSTVGFWRPCGSTRVFVCVCIVVQCLHI